MRRALPLTLGTLLLPLPAFFPPCSGSSCAAAHASAAVMSAARAHHSASKSISSGLLLRMVRCARAPSAATTSSKSSDSAVTATVVHSKACAWAREGRGEQSASRGINTRAPAVQHPRTSSSPGRRSESRPAHVAARARRKTGSAWHRSSVPGGRWQRSMQAKAQRSTRARQHPAPLCPPASALQPRAAHLRGCPAKGSHGRRLARPRTARCSRARGSSLLAAPTLSSVAQGHRIKKAPRERERFAFHTPARAQRHGRAQRACRP